MVVSAGIYGGNFAYQGVHDESHHPNYYGGKPVEIAGAESDELIHHTANCAAECHFQTLKHVTLPIPCAYLHGQ